MLIPARVSRGPVHRLVTAWTPGVALIRLALHRSGQSAIKVTGTSMLPAIEPGTVVTVSAVPFGGVRTGDVAAVAHGDKVVVHRVAGRTGTDLLLLGDNLPLYDPPTPPEDYLGVILDAPEAASRQPLLARALTVAAGQPGPPAHDPEYPVLFRTPGEEPAPGHRLRVGISSAGAFPAPVLGQVLASPAARRRGVEILVGYGFGDPGMAPPDAPMLRPDEADLHIRLGRPLQEIRFSKAISIIRAAETIWASAVPARTGAGPEGDRS